MLTQSNATIDALQHEERRYVPSPEFVAQANFGFYERARAG